MADYGAEASMVVAITVAVTMAEAITAEAGVAVTTGLTASTDQLTAEIPEAVAMVTIQEERPVTAAEATTTVQA